MRSHHHRLRGIGLLILGGILAAAAWADEIIEMATYIPAPSVGGNSFDRLHARRMTVGETAPLNFSTTNPDDAALADGTLLVSERIGIGTASPFGPLHVHSAASQGTIRVSGASDNGNTFSGLYLHDASADFNNNWVIAHKNRTGTPEAGALHFVRWTNPATASTVMALQPTGNVGIGVTAPSVRVEVAQNGAVKVGSAYLSSGGDYAHLANNEWFNGSAWQATAAGALIQLTGQETVFYRHTAAGNHTESMRITAGGRVGIGTATPQRHLHINGGAHSYLRLESTATDWVIGAEGTGNNRLIFHDGAQYRMVLTGDGNLGIGTNSPSGRLDVLYPPPEAVHPAG